MHRVRTIQPRTAFLLSGLLLVQPVVAPAQVVVSPGDTIRFSTGARAEVVGRFLGVDGDSIRMAEWGSAGQELPVSFHVIQAFGVERRGRRTQARSGLGLGVMLGGGLGMAIGITAMSEEGFLSGTEPLQGFVLGALAGAVVGVGIGVSRKVETWTPAVLPSSSAGVELLLGSDRAGGGLGVGVRIRPAHH